MTDKKSITIQVRPYTYDRIQWKMNNQDPPVPKDKQSEFIEELIVTSLNKKHTQDYMLHQGYIREESKCSKCHTVLEPMTFAMIGGGVVVCQECFSKKWTTPAIERRRQVKMDLENDINCLTMDYTAAGLKLDEAKKELGYANDLRSMLEIYKAKEHELNEAIEGKNRELEQLIYELNEGNNLKSSLPELQIKRKTIVGEIENLTIKAQGLKLRIEENELLRLLDMYLNKLPSYEQPEFFHQLKDQYTRVKNLENGIIATANRSLIL